jgi:hypothetical protein
MGLSTALCQRREGATTCGDSLDQEQPDVTNEGDAPAKRCERRGKDRHSPCIGSKDRVKDSDYPDQGRKLSWIRGA